MAYFKTDKFMKIFTLLLLLFSLVGCVNRQRKQYNHICDSLSRLTFPPREFDTLFFHKYGNGFAVDTVYPNGERHFIELDYKHDYDYFIEYSDNPIIDVMSYDGKDGKLLDWHQRFVNWENISPYWVYYDKEGNVCDFYIIHSDKEGYIYPTYSIHQLIDKLKKENIDLFHNISIYYYGKDYFDTDSVPYKRWGWYVDIKDTIDSNDNYNMTGRLYDGQTGELLDVYRGEWEDWHGNNQRHLK